MSGEIERHLQPVPDEQGEPAPLEEPPATAAPAQPAAGEGEDVLEGEIVDDRPAAVDPPDRRDDRPPSARIADRMAERAPVVPGWVRDRRELAHTWRWVHTYARHVSAFHLVRVPRYAGVLTIRAPRGAARVAGGVARWVGDAESAPLRADAASRRESREYLHLLKRRSEKVRLRGLMALAAGAVAITAVVLLLTATPRAVWALAALAAVGALGWAGSPADKPVVGRAVTPTMQPKLTADAIERALAALGLSGISRAMSKGGEGIGIPNPIQRDGPGWRADIDLPLGVTPAEVIERRAKLASGLRRSLGCVWPEANPAIHEGRMVLWVGDMDMARMPNPQWPLLTSKGVKPVDVFEPVPFGTDQRGRPLALTLMFEAVLIGSKPRYGKTAALRILALALALDPRVQLWVFELKGSGDMSALAKVAHRYTSGMDEDAIVAALEALRDLEADLERRSKVLGRLPRSECPEGKITPKLAARRDLGLEPIGFLIDECQELYGHEKHGKEASRIATRVTKLGPAFGIMPLFATQRPDADSLPTGVSANAGIRFCLRVMDQLANDMVLGTSSYKAGIRATTFGEKDKGLGYLVGATESPSIARSYYVDGDKAGTITDRARELREAAGTLTGHAIGEATTSQARDLLADVAGVAAGDDKIWTETLLARLVEAYPDTYRDWTQTGVSAALGARGIDVGQVWSQGRNRRGIALADVREVSPASGPGARPSTPTSGQDGS